MINTLCDRCKKESFSSYFPTDFHGNTIGLVCNLCISEVNKMLDRVFITFGGYKTPTGTILASPKGSPRFRNFLELESFYEELTHEELT